ncbi:hypothetical protein BZL54_02825 [Burkholderia ubonensis subsp. mesacidophila]|uniref:Uncharacterized protein n=1 Tax=Burkholderia ubonensis subsp. mesacidophila TaxID=265293 RepID=A0A2A4FMQ6_9BURK|nr:hypothetical protein BZL54_02825 [Burkholderia ubonensis subsp. mesacidophila]
MVRLFTLDSDIDEEKVMTLKREACGNTSGFHYSSYVSQPIRIQWDRTLDTAVSFSLRASM